MIKLRIKFQQETGTTGVQLELVYLTGAQKENSMVPHRIGGKINFMFPLSTFHGQDEKEVVPVQIMNQIASAQNILYPTDFEPLGGWQFRLGGVDLSDWNFFHFDFICLPKIMNGDYFTIMVRRCTV